MGLKDHKARLVFLVKMEDRVKDYQVQKATVESQELLDLLGHKVFLAIQYVLLKYVTTIRTFVTFRGLQEFQEYLV